MNAVVIDTNIYSLSMKNDDFAREVLTKAESILVCPIVIGELLSGFRFGSRMEENMKLFNEFLDSPRVKVVDVTEKTALHYSQIYLDLKNAGAPIPTNDIWIAAVAREYGSSIATADNHFRSVPGLLLIN